VKKDEGNLSDAITERIGDFYPSFPICKLRFGYLPLDGEIGAS
jgi:hypothetical protein